MPRRLSNCGMGLWHYTFGGMTALSTMDRDVLKQIYKEMDDLLSLRQGFVNEYREWRTTVSERMTQACGEECAKEFETKGPRDTPINRQHRVHNYRQTLVAQMRYITQLLEENPE